MRNVVVVVVVSSLAASLARAQAAPDSVSSSGATRSAVHGVVLDDGDHPIAAATITVPGGPAGAGAITDADGTFTLPALDDGAHTLAIGAFGYASASITIATPSPSSAPIVIRLHGADAPGEEIVIAAAPPRRGSTRPSRSRSCPATACRRARCSPRRRST